MAEAVHEREMLLADGKTDFREGMRTIYPHYDKPGMAGNEHRLNTCTGCSACGGGLPAETTRAWLVKTVQRAHEMQLAAYRPLLYRRHGAKPGCGLPTDALPALR